VKITHSWRDISKTRMYRSTSPSLTCIHGATPLTTNSGIATATVGMPSISRVTSLSARMSIVRAVMEDFVQKIHSGSTSMRRVESGKSVMITASGKSASLVRSSMALPRGITAMNVPSNTEAQNIAVSLSQ
jgi:hypothetical protein